MKRQYAHKVHFYSRNYLINSNLLHYISLAPGKSNLHTFLKTSSGTVPSLLWLTEMPPSSPLQPLFQRSDNLDFTHQVFLLRGPVFAFAVIFSDEGFGLEFACSTDLQDTDVVPFLPRSRCHHLCCRAVLLQVQNRVPRS